MQERTRTILTNFEKWLCYLFLFIMTISVMVQFFSRLVYYPLSWGEEVARYSYIWLAFIGASYAVMTRDHIQISFFLNKLSLKTQKMILIGQNVMIIIALLWILPSAFAHSIEQFQNLSPALEMPTFYPYISFPIGMALVIVRLLQLIVSDYRSMKNTE